MILKGCFAGNLQNTPFWNDELKSVTFLKDLCYDRENVDKTTGID